MRIAIRRLAIVADVPLALEPPRDSPVAWVHGFSKVSIGNACSADLKIFTDDPAHYVAIEPTYERMIHANFDRPTPLSVCGLFALSTVNGTVVLIWS